MSIKTDFNENAVLIEHLIKGEEKAFMFLIDSYHKKLHTYALTLIGNYSIAQDIVQNVFLKVWKNRKRLNSNLLISSFLYKSVYNEFINEYHKNKKVIILQQQYYDSLSEVMEEVDIETYEILSSLVTEEIKKLPPKCQKIFILSKKEGLTYNEISEYYNISVKTVEAQMSKAYTIIRNKLGDKYKTIFIILFEKNINVLH
ncbi:RNA polymerase sigma-70 factor [Aureibaculum algae]|uniref:RNA polymerase sigma-70 factor n=1 Tax=Aureibaculum algae TaxID=2584122 RepID=A0A5B7TQI3_9FLAO|nr:RNA polymerase sigma-70 factor [Aureibaculum algae]QCX37443.1 RNA polymerase sigma-70 factor [Aureibaculum algae]